MFSNLPKFLLLPLTLKGNIHTALWMVSAHVYVDGRVNVCGRVEMLNTVTHFTRQLCLYTLKSRYVVCEHVADVHYQHVLISVIGNMGLYMYCSTHFLPSHTAYTGLLDGDTNVLNVFEFACSPCVWVGSLLPPHPPKTKSPIGVNVCFQVTSSSCSHTITCVYYFIHFSYQHEPVTLSHCYHVITELSSSSAPWTVHVKRFFKGLFGQNNKAK